MAVLVMPAVSRAEEKVWQKFGSMNQFWDIPENWSPAGQPATGDNARLVGSAATNSSVLFYNFFPAVPTVNTVTLDQVGGGRIDLLLHENYIHEFRASTLIAGFGGFGGVAAPAGNPPPKAGLTA